jgi:hypothetical protein
MASILHGVVVRSSSEGKGRAVSPSPTSTPAKTRREHVNALVRLANVGARRQQRFALLDLVPLLLPIVALIWFVPVLGWILVGFFVLLVVLYTLLLQTAGARSRKALDDPRDVKKVIVARAGRHGMARAWMVVQPNRLVVVALLRSDIDVFLSALKTVAPHVASEVFDSPIEARDAANKMLKTANK